MSMVKTLTCNSCKASDHIFSGISFRLKTLSTCSLSCMSSVNDSIASKKKFFLFLFIHFEKEVFCFFIFFKGQPYFFYFIIELQQEKLNKINFFPPFFFI